MSSPYLYYSLTIARTILFPLGGALLSWHIFFKLKKGFSNQGREKRD